MTSYSIITVTVLAMTLLMCSGISALREGFYSTSCPIYKKMQELVVDEEDLPAYILRLFFHDCFVRVSNPCKPGDLLCYLMGLQGMSEKLPNTVDMHNSRHNMNEKTLNVLGN